MAKSFDADSPSVSTSGRTRTNDIFISYSRKDKAFVQRLDAAFREQNRDPWVDWDDIRKGEDWWKSIQRGIESADIFVFVVSPASVASEICRDEIEHAAQCHKRFLPIVHREGFTQEKLHPSISQHNWLFFRETDDFESTFQELLKALETDIVYIQAHTRLLLRALEWENAQQDGSYLLRGTDLDDAQQWLNQNVNKEPRPTDGQASYIAASSQVRKIRRKARRKAKWTVGITTVLANFVFVVVGLFGLYWYMTTLVEAQVLKTMRDSLEGTLSGIDGDEFEEFVQLSQGSNTADLAKTSFYQEHQAWLKAVQTIDPEARAITYVETEETDVLVAIGDSLRGNQREVTAIANLHNEWGFRDEIILDDTNHQSMLYGLESSSLAHVTSYMDLYDVVESDAQGNSWINIYAPIRNSIGESVGGLKLRYDTTYIGELDGNIAITVVGAWVVVLIWLITLSGLILHVTRVPKDT